MFDVHAYNLAAKNAAVIKEAMRSGLINRENSVHDALRQNQKIVELAKQFMNLSDEYHNRENCMSIIVEPGKDCFMSCHLCAADCMYNLLQMGVIEYV